MLIYSNEQLVWSPNLWTFKRRSPSDGRIYIIIYIFKKRFIYKIIIRSKRIVAQQSSGGAAGKWCAKWASVEQ